MKSSKSPPLASEAWQSRVASEPERVKEKTLLRSILSDSLSKKVSGCANMRESEGIKQTRGKNLVEAKHKEEKAAA